MRFVLRVGNIYLDRTGEKIIVRKKHIDVCGYPSKKTNGFIVGYVVDPYDCYFVRWDGKYLKDLLDEDQKHPCDLVKFVSGTLVRKIDVKKIKLTRLSKYNNLVVANIK